GGCLPRLGANALLSVDRDGNFTIGRVIGISVSGLHHQTEASALIWRYPGVAARWFRGQYMPEPENGFEPVRQIAVKWQHKCGLRIGADISQDQILSVTPAACTIPPLWSADDINKID